jgi:hypothetical protein
MMVDQTKRLDYDLIVMIDGNKSLEKFAGKLKNKYSLAGWLGMVREHR